MKKFILRTTLFTLLALCFLPGIPPEAHAADDLEIAGWIPYWRVSQGVEDAKDHLQEIDTLFPFAFSVTSTGELRDLAGLDEDEWQDLFRRADREDIEIIPTVMTSDGELVHRLLSNPLTRKLHALLIALMVAQGEYDGVDIDYEGKKAATYEYFGLFLKDLKSVLGGKVLSCTIEARTPPESLYREIPEEIEYANDLEAIAEYCDRVQIMAYDQQRADLTLNDMRKGEPYMPVADVDWVEKVLTLMLEDIPSEKVVLGVPTYGHHYFLEVAPDWYKTYTRIGALNLPDIHDLADEYDVEPSRNQAGEMSFTYIHKSSPLRLSRSLDIPKDTPEGNIIAARALAYANKTGNSVPIRIVWYSDAEAIKDKIDLAEKYDLKGVSLFKIDGEEDQEVWEYLR